MEHVQRVDGENVTFNPSVDDVKKNPGSEVRMVFDSFKAMIKVFGNVPESAYRTVSIKKKVERSSGNVASARIL